ncbi:MAG: porin [Planctomycetota bacterium]
MKPTTLLAVAFASVLLAVALDAQTTKTEINSNSFKWESDGFSLRMQNYVQFRMTVQEEVGQSGPGGTNGRDFINFNVARGKTDFRGYIFERAFGYRVRLNWTRPAAQILEVAHFRWAFMQYVNVNAGQVPLAWSWEEQVDATELQFQERSYVNEVFNQDYAKGVWVDGHWGDDVPWIKYWGGVYNGVLAANDDFRNKDGAVTSDAFSDVIDQELMLNARVETHPFGLVLKTLGDRRPEEEHAELLLAFGAGFNLLFSGVNNADLRLDSGATATGSGRSRVRQETYAVTIDGHMRWYGISVDAAFYWRHTDFHNRGINSAPTSHRRGIGDLDDLGWSFEASYYIHLIDLSVGARVSAVDADEFWGRDAALTQTDRQQRAIRPDAMEYAFTASYLFQGERLKFSLDIVYVDQQLAYSYKGAQYLSGVYNAPLTRNGQVGQSRANADHDVLWIVRLQVQWIL